MSNISPKVSSAAAAGAVTVVLVWALGLLGVVVPAEVASSVTVLITAGVGYAVRDPAREV